MGPLRAAWGPYWHVLRRPCSPTLLDICSLRSLRKRDKPQDGASCSVPVSSAAGPQPQARIWCLIIWWPQAHGVLVPGIPDLSSHVNKWVT